VGLHRDEGLVHLSSQTINRVISHAEIKPGPKGGSLLPPRSQHPAWDRTPEGTDGQPEPNAKQTKAPTLPACR